MAKDTQQSGQVILTKTSLTAGVWQGELHGLVDGTPDLVATHMGEEVPGPDVTEDGEVWQVRFALPADRIADGVQTFVIADRATGEVLSSFAVMAGEALGEDIRAEIDLMRAELDMLKKAFRRHCVETQ
ncbi:hypothetical protein AB3Y40_17515 [Yoonia sp. R2331]|uniref:hypothetical protein n=1 Tax=Yoonia sp. R2331 TaxID=3237238 RepID=UPI0034E5F5BE